MKIYVSSAWPAHLFHYWRFLVLLPNGNQSFKKFLNPHLRFITASCYHLICQCYSPICISHWDKNVNSEELQTALQTALQTVWSLNHSFYSAKSFIIWAVKQSMFILQKAILYEFSHSYKIAFCKKVMSISRLWFWLLLQQIFTVVCAIVHANLFIPSQSGTLIW